MTKKDEKDADRPHYYSQFWLDVAAGRRVIGTPKPEDGMDDAEDDLPEPTPMTRKGGRTATTLPVDGYQESRATAVAEPDLDDAEINEPEEDVIDLASDLEDEDIPTIVVDDTLDTGSADSDVLPADAEVEEDLEEEEEFFDEEEEEEEEEEEDQEWPARGRKKPKPGRPVKAPKPPVKKPKRGGPRF